jgi:hypothetical protein
VIIFSGSGANFSLRDASTGEFINDVSLTAVPSGSFRASVNVTENDSDNVNAGTNFTIGHADNDVRPQIGDTVSLTSGTGSVFVDFTDRFNQPLPAGTTISVAAGTGGCLITNNPGRTQLSTNTTSVNSVFIALANDPAAANGSAPITVTVTTPNSVVSTFSFTCTF